MSTGYLIVIEGDDDSGYSSYSPDLPGVIAAAETTRDECETLMRGLPYRRLDRGR